MAALDPAGAAFWKWKFIPDLVLPKQRLHRGDALFVDVYHTSSFFGCRKKLGTVDFYINGGESQPSCVPQFLSHLIRDYLRKIFSLSALLKVKQIFNLIANLFPEICSHNYVTALFAKSISDNSTKACQCPSYGSYLNKTCDCSSSAVVGEFIDT